jgi:hypothetical protein
VDFAHACRKGGKVDFVFAYSIFDMYHFSIAMRVLTGPGESDPTHKMGESIGG